MFIVIAGWLYETSEIIGVKSTERKAKRLSKETKEKHNFDFIDIEEWDLDGKRLASTNYFERYK